jgi:hypothetical protein
MKVQPNFSWQKYEGEAEDQKEQFQFQLQQEHIVCANAINATIDDESYFTKERKTSFTWVDGKPIYTKTLVGVITTAPGFTAIPHGIASIDTLVSLTGTAQDAHPIAAFGNTLPFVDPVTLANGIGLFLDTVNVYTHTGNATWLNYIFHATIQYTK